MIKLCHHQTYVNQSSYQYYIASPCVLKPCGLANWPYCSPVWWKASWKKNIQYKHLRLVEHFWLRSSNWFEAWMKWTRAKPAIFWKYVQASAFIFAKQCRTNMYIPSVVVSSMCSMVESSIWSVWQVNIFSIVERSFVGWLPGLLTPLDGKFVPKLEQFQPLRNHEQFEIVN